MVYGITYTVCMTLFSRIASAKSSTDSTVFVSSNVFTWRERERKREREREGGERTKREGEWLTNLNSKTSELLKRA